MSLVHSEDAVQGGVQLCYAHCLFLAPEPDPFWADSVQGFRRMSDQELQLFSRPVDWPDIQAAAAAAAAIDACSSTSSGMGDGSIDSYAAAATATSFVDGYTFNTVGFAWLWMVRAIFMRWHVISTPHMWEFSEGEQNGIWFCRLAL